VGRAHKVLDTLVTDGRAAIFHTAVNVVLASSLVPRHLRRTLYRALGFTIGAASLSAHLNFKSSNIDIGDRVYVNEGCVFDNLAQVTIGDFVHIGPEVLVGTTSHEIGPSSCRAGPTQLAPVCIGAGSWIGARAIVLPGVSVGEGCVIAAGAVVTRDCRPNGLYAGVPARRIRDL